MNLNNIYFYIWYVYQIIYKSIHPSIHPWMRGHVGDVCGGIKLIKIQIYRLVSPGGFVRVNQRCYSGISLQLFKCVCIYLQFPRKIWCQFFISSSFLSCINTTFKIFSFDMMNDIRQYIMFVKYFMTSCSVPYYVYFYNPKVSQVLRKFS